jgi:hypothetical protein
MVYLRVFIFHHALLGPSGGLHMNREAGSTSIAMEWALHKQDKAQTLKIHALNTVCWSDQ